MTSNFKSFQSAFERKNSNFFLKKELNIHVIHINISTSETFVNINLSDPEVKQIHTKQR